MVDRDSALGLGSQPEARKARATRRDKLRLLRARAPGPLPAPARGRGPYWRVCRASGGGGSRPGRARRPRPLLRQAHWQLKVTVMQLSPGQPPSQDSDMQENGSSLHHQMSKYEM